VTHATPRPTAVTRLQDLETVNGRLRQRLQDLKEEAVKNEAILRKFQALELEFLSADSLPELLHLLVEGTARSLALDEASLMLLDPDHEVRHLLFHGGAEPEEFPAVLFVDSPKALKPPCTALRRPWLGPYQSGEHSTLFRSGGWLRSVAVLPLVRQGCLFGSLNLASGDGRRYTPHHATDFHGRLASVAAVCLENVINRERLLLSGLTDILTGWHNRRYLQRRLPEELARAGRYRQPLSALLLDVDHFKRVNDSYGHAAGDQVLRDVASRVKHVLRTSDVAVRYGGEEFAVLLPQTGLRDAARMAERIRHTVATGPFSIKEGPELDVTVSIGVAEVWPAVIAADAAVLGEQLLSRADGALYRAKSAGRNRVMSAGDSEQV